MAASVIVAHNHPSGILQPSDADITFTKKLKKALQLIDVKLLDHLIISESGYLSIMQRDLI
jgi:DNA repair protein RadC